MTISNTTTTNSLETNGVTVDFPFTFYTTESSQVKCKLIFSDGTSSDFTGFTVSRSVNGNGGTVTTNTTLNNVTLIIYRNTPVTQETDYVKGGRFPADSHEQALDKLTQIDQEQYEILSRTMQQPIGGGPWDAKGERIINLATGIAGSDATNLSQVKYEINKYFSDKDGIGLVPLLGTPAICDGVRTEFDVAGDKVYPPTAYRIYLDGVRQHQLDVVSQTNRWEITDIGKIVFAEPPEQGVEFSSDLFAPLTRDDSTDGITFTQVGAGAVPVSLSSKLGESATLKDYGALGVEAQDATQAFINACNAHSTVYLIDGIYKVSADKIESTAKVRKIILQNATLRLEDGQFDFYVAGQQLTIDLTAGGVIHGGLRMTSPSADVAVGEYVIPCNDTSDIVVGQTIASSFQATGATGGSKWTNSIRVTGDEFNEVVGKTANSITVKFPVGATGSGTPTNALWKNMLIGNGIFSRAGLRFNGYGKVTINGGEIKECRSGYYISTEGDNTEDGLLVETHDVDFSGQFLDGFRIGGYSSFIANGGSMIGSYDLSKQLFVLQHRHPHKVELNNVKVARGNNDLEFYTFGNTAGGKIGLTILNNCDFDGKWTLGVTADQVNTITGQTLQQTYGIIQDALHCWTCEQLTPTSPDTVSRIAGFVARGTTFRNYKRAVAGTTFINVSRSFELDNFIMDDCVFENTAPFYISVAATYNYNMINKGISNAKITRNVDNGTVYPLGLYNYEDGLHYSGSTIYDPKDGLVTDPTPANNNGGSVNGLISFDHLIVRGSGQIKANLPELNVSRLTVDEAFFYDIAGFNEYVPTKITLVNGGSLNSAHSFTTDRVATSSTLVEIPANNTEWHVIRKNVQRTTVFSAYLLITFSGYRRFADEYGFEGVAAGKVAAIASPITAGQSGYVNVTASDAVHWISKSVLSHGFNLADGSVELVIDSNGDLAMRMTQAQPKQITLTVDVKGGKRYD